MFRLVKLPSRTLMPFVFVSVGILSGCSTTSGDVAQGWPGSGNARTTVDSTTTGILDPITAIAAAQHPLSKQALQHIGIRYRYGGTSPSNGFDCSGLVHYSARESLGLQLPRRSSDIARAGKPIKRQELTVGDLVFFNTLGARYSHVGIYVGSDMFVHAPSSGGVVRVEAMSNPYWNKRFTAARRIDPVMIAAR